MQYETNQAFRRPGSAVPARHRLSIPGALRVAVIMAVLLSLFGVEITLRIAPQIGTIGNAAIIWLVWRLLRPDAWRHRD